MTKDEVRAAAERLVEFHERFAPLFGKEQAQDNAYSYIKGLMVCPERKSIEPIALNVGNGNVSAMQKFVNIAPWDHDDIQAEVQAVFAEELVPTAADSPVGVVGVVDESGFSKKGNHSAGVARQHNGRLGKEDNCQVGVYLGYASRQDHALVDCRLFLPQEWAKDKDRRLKAGVPKQVRFQTRHELALAMLDEHGTTLPHAWVTGDDEMGRSSWFRQELRQRHESYLLAVPSNTRVRDVLAAELTRHAGDLLSVEVPDQGMHLVAYLRGGLSDVAIQEAAHAGGVIVRSISQLYIAAPPRSALNCTTSPSRKVRVTPVTVTPRGPVGTVKRIVPLAERSCGPVKTSPDGMLRRPSELIQVRPVTSSVMSVPSASIRTS